MSALDDVIPQSLSQHELRLLYQAHKLMTKGWPLQKGSSLSSAAAAAADHEHWQQHQQLLAAAQEAVAAYAAVSAARSKQHVAAVVDAFEDLGFDPPVKGLKVDGLQPDLAFVASSSSSSSKGEKGDVKVALMCDHAGRYSRNAPFELLGYWRVHEWLLEADGWRVVRFPVHEWKVLMQDTSVHEGPAVGYVYNTLITQGIHM
jgi:hypothetical protein